MIAPLNIATVGMATFNLALARSTAMAVVGQIYKVAAKVAACCHQIEISESCQENCVRAWSRASGTNVEVKISYLGICLCGYGIFAYIMNGNQAPIYTSYIALSVGTFFHIVLKEKVLNNFSITTTFDLNRIQDLLNIPNSSIVINEPATLLPNRLDVLRPHLLKIKTTNATFFSASAA